MLTTTEGYSPPSFAYSRRLPAVSVEAVPEAQVEPRCRGYDTNIKSSPQAPVDTGATQRHRPELQRQETHVLTR